MTRLWLRPRCGDVDREADATDKKTVFERVEAGEITLEEFKQAYRENLDLVLEECERVRDAVDGKIVVSSDHGEAFGEQGELGHPR